MFVLLILQEYARDITKEEPNSLTLYKAYLVLPRHSLKPRYASMPRDNHAVQHSQQFMLVVTVARPRKVVVPD